MSCSERRRELKRRRHRKEKVVHLCHRAEKANASEKTHIAQKMRKLTPGAESIIQRLNLEER